MMNKTIQQARFHCNAHMSLLNTFYVFGTITLINIPLQLVGIFLWLHKNCSSYVNCFGVATLALKDIAFMAIIVFGMIFFTTYYSAVFLEIPKFSYPFGTVVVASIYMHYEPKSQKCLNLLSTRKLSNKSQNCLYKVSNQFLIWSQTYLKI